MLFFAFLVTYRKFRKIEAPEGKNQAKIGSCRPQILAQINIFRHYGSSKGRSNLFFFIFLEFFSFFAEFKAIFRFFEFFAKYPLLIYCEAASHSFWSIAPFFFIELKNMINLLIEVISSK